MQVRGEGAVRVGQGMAGHRNRSTPPWHVRGRGEGVGAKAMGGGQVKGEGTLRVRQSRAGTRAAAKEQG